MSDKSDGMISGTGNGAVPPPPGHLTLELVRRALEQTLQSSTRDAEPWLARAQRAAAETGRNSRADALGPLRALIKSREAGTMDPLQRAIAKQYGAILDRMDAHRLRIADHLSELSELTAKGARETDPRAANRILERMRTIGNATLRHIEDRIGSTGSREEGKRMRTLRDEMNSWFAERDARLTAAKIAADELNRRVTALRKACLLQSGRLASVADGVQRGAVDPPSGKQTAGSAENSSDALRALLHAARSEIIAPLR